MAKRDDVIRRVREEMAEIFANTEPTSTTLRELCGRGPTEVALPMRDVYWRSYLTEIVSKTRAEWLVLGRESE